MLIPVNTIGTPLAHHLASRRAFRVLARFDSTMQLEFDDGQLWAITTRANVGAFRAVVDALPVGQNLILSYDASALWNPRPRRRALSMVERESAARALAAQIHARALPETRGFWDVLADDWGALAAGLRQRDAASLRATMARLIGRGAGLTPAGDDFVQALLVTLRTGDAHDRAAFHALARAVAPLIPRTTRASQAFLREALRGWAFGPLKDSLDALPGVPSALVRDLLRVGASSGAAYALGVLMGLAYESD